jgi:hypothetical protein
MAVAEIVEDIAEGFDEARGELLGHDAKLVLLEEDDEGESGAPFIQVRVVESGWFPKFSEFFGTTTFMVADISEVFGADVNNRTTHVTVTGSDIPALNNLLHELAPETAAPTGDKPFWRIRAKSLGRRYVPPVEG